MGIGRKVHARRDRLHADGNARCDASGVGIGCEEPEEAGKPGSQEARKEERVTGQAHLHVSGRGKP